MSTIRAVLVDDEPLARARLRALLAGYRQIEIVGEAGGGSAAVELIASVRPDLIFLDIEMPGFDGFEVLRAIPAGQVPLVIVVTAFNEHAVRAFEVEAVDYVLKPVMEDRFNAAVARAIERFERGPHDIEARVRAVLKRMQERIAVRNGGVVVFVRVDDIDWAQVDGNGVRLYAGSARHVLHETMAELEKRLPAERFARIHRSIIVNVDRIARVEPWFKGDHVVILRDGTRLTSGRTYRERMKLLLR
jgi:two-component system LytT family response regulator